MLRHGASVFGPGRDLAVLAVSTAIFVAIASRMYPRMTE